MASAVASKHRRYQSLYIGGRWSEASFGNVIAVENPATEEPFASVPAGTAADVDAAVAEARQALEGWAAQPPTERASVLTALAEGLAARTDEIAEIVAREVGTPLARSREWQAEQPAHVLRLYAELTPIYPFEEQVASSRVLREPRGVVACIAPWNFPLHQIILKVAPALAAGCTIVLKPSSLAPLTAFILAEAAEAVPLPAGVLNVVSGSAATVGRALVSHPHVDMISFTGSTVAGADIARQAGGKIKRVTLELGGKSANVVLEDADMERAVAEGVHNCYANAGQTCAAWTRMLVPRSRLREAEEIAADVANAYVLGDPLDPATTLGPVISAAQRDHVLAHVKAAEAEGARIVAGSAARPSRPGRGYFVPAVVLSDVRPEMAAAREEIFGPVLTILPFDGDEEAVALANDTDYGLSGAVWSGDSERALRVARRLRTGQVFVNGAAFNYQAPFGGYKKSGIGREFGRFGLDEFVELKAVQL